MAEENTDNQETTALTTPGAPKVQIIQAGKPADKKSGVLAIQVPDINTLSAKSEFHGGTEIGLALGQAVVPVGYGIFSVPDKVLKGVQDEIMNSETLAPIDIVMIKRQLIRFQEMTADLVMAISGGDDLNRLYMYQAVQNSTKMAQQYCEGMLAFCKDIGTFRQQYASQEAFFMSQTLSKESVQMEVDMELIDAPIEAMVTHLNAMTAGEGGYQIVSLLAAIDEVRSIITNDTVLKLFGASNPRALFNRIDFKIEQSDLMFYRQLSMLAEMIKPRMQPDGRNKAMNGQDIVTMINLAENAQKGLERMQEMLSKQS